MSFDSVRQLYLQPSALDADPDFERAMFMRDIDQQRRLGSGAEQRRLAADRAAFEADLSEREGAAQRTFRNLTPKEKKYHPTGNPNQYMIDARLRENAVAEYDRNAPRLREERARARTERG